MTIRFDFVALECEDQLMSGADFILSDLCAALLIRPQALGDVGSFKACFETIVRLTCCFLSIRVIVLCENDWDAALANVGRLQALLCFRSKCAVKLDYAFS